VGRLDLLPALYDTILIPPAVHAEAAAQGSGAIDLAQAIWLTVQAPVDSAAVDELRRSGLDDGESEAIVLADELGARLLIDEYQGRRVTSQRGIPMTGTVGIVVAAARSDLISVNDVEGLLRQMVRARFRISDGLIRHAVALARSPRP
jgi:predicted nucleic acid-binding protein